MHQEDCSFLTSILGAQELFEQTEALLDKWKHPEPFRPATAPGGAIILTQSLRLRIGELMENSRVEIREKHACTYIRSYVYSLSFEFETAAKLRQRLLR